jgi:hypothetical protein
MFCNTSSMQGRWKPRQYSSKRSNAPPCQGTYLVLFQTVLKDVLDNETARLAQSNLVPHALQSLVDVLHDLWRRVRPAKFEELLPDMAGIAMDDSLGNPAEQLVHHDSLVLLRDRIECLLNDVAAKRIHGEVERVAANRLGNLDDLLRSTVLKASLDQEVAKPVDHERIGLGYDCLDNVVLLLRGPDLELLLQEYGRLLVIVADNLVDDVLPVACDIAVKEPAVVERLRRRQKRLDLGARLLENMITLAKPRSSEDISDGDDVLTSVFHGPLAVVNSDAWGESGEAIDCC